MKSSVKKLLAVLLVLAMALSIVACSGGTTTNDSSSTPADNSESTPAESTGDGEGEAEPYDITISLQASDADQAGWEAVAEGYKKYHPEANIIIDLKPADGYDTWLQGIGSDYMNSTVDLIAVNLLSSRTEDETINWNEYMNEVNPYDSEGKIWKDCFEWSAQIRNPVDNSFDALSLFSVQVVFFYNMDIFEEVGVEPPTTWDELVDVCEKIQAAGYQPLSIPGDYDSFYAGTMGWLSQMYTDQTTRTMVEVTRAQPGDYCYDPDVDGNFTLDITDPWNDDAAYFHNNPVRFWAAVHDGTYTANTPGTAAIWENMAKVFPKYAGGDAFFGTDNNGGWSLFYQGKAAMNMNVAGFAVGFENTMKKADAGEEIEMGEETVEGVHRFRLGSFNVPSMTNEDGQWGADELFQAPVRTIEVSNGFLGSFSRGAEHDAHVVDFVMYYSSAEGMSAYINAALEEDWSPSGSSLVYGITYPDELQAAFDNLTFIGNCQKGYGQALSRGIADNQESTRAYYTLAQQCLTGQITPEEYAAGMAAQHMQYFEEAKGTGISMADLEHPENEPTGEETE